MVRWAILLMKLVIGGCVIWQTTDYVLNHYPIYVPGLPFELALWCSVVVIAASACLFLIALMFINEENIFRVLINWVIIGFFTSATWAFGYLITPAPKDHFEQMENWYAYLICPIIGALMGYVACVMREPTSEIEQDELEQEENHFESERFVDIAHD